MGLRDLRLPQEEVEVPGSDSFAVRGLGLADITQLARRHGAVLSVLFAKVKEQGGEMTFEQLSALGHTLLDTAPEVAHEIIALAASTNAQPAGPEDIAVASMLPFPVQIDALEKTIALTLTSEAAVKKVAETVIRAAQGMTKLTKSLKT